MPSYELENPRSPIFHTQNISNNNTLHWWERAIERTNTRNIFVIISDSHIYTTARKDLDSLIRELKRIIKWVYIFMKSSI